MIVIKMLIKDFLYVPYVTKENHIMFQVMNWPSNAFVWALMISRPWVIDICYDH